MADLSGQTLGQYRLQELIGVGGMAAVYRAHQESMGRDVAIKVMAMQLAENEEFVARFEREAHVIARLQHPHILPVIDFGRDKSQVFLVMRLVEGGMLSQRLARSTLSVRQVEQFLTQIGSALEYAHQRGVIHRDLKPNNVLLDESDNAYLTDFGIAKMLAGATTSQLSLTATGSVMGTPAYMAPEQWRSEAVDARTDIYALGIILYEMLMGVLPFHSDTPFGMMYKHFDAPPPAPSAINPALPHAMEQIVLRAMAKNGNDRYPSARQMAEEFSSAVRTMPPDAVNMPLPRATPDQIAQATPPSQSRPPAAGTMATRAAQLSSESQVLRTPVPTQARPAQPRAGGRGVLVGGVLVVLIVAAAVVGLLLMSGGDGDGGDKTSPAGISAESGTQTAVALAGQPPDERETPRGDLDTGTPKPDQTGPPLRTAIVLLPGDTDTPSPEPSTTLSDTPTREPSDTPSPEPSVTPSNTPTDTLTPTDTPDLGQTADALLAQRLTQTASAWTDTPTPDIEASVIAAITGTAAAWTDTPTSTLTPTAVPTLPPPPTRTPLPPSSTPRPTITPRPVLPTRTPQCSTLRSRVDVGVGARTTLSPDESTRIRRAPGLSSPTDHSIPPGQTFWITDGPQCADSLVWWQVEGYDTSGEWAGWIAEGQGSTYWIEPFDTGPVDCPGAPPPRLTPGKTGRVTVSPPLPSRVRSSPERLDNNVIGQFQPGDTFEVISGPVCDTTNRWRWWLLRGRSVEGWVAEGPLGEYWLEPWP